MAPIAAVKNPKHVAAGKASALARWGPEPRVLRLDVLPAPVRAAILAMVEADKAARAKHELEAELQARESER